MKQLTELKDGQKVLLELTVKTINNGYSLNNGNITIQYIHKRENNFFANGYTVQPQLNIYDFEEVMSVKKSEPISKEEFYKKMDEFSNEGLHFYFSELKKYVYDLFTSYHPESFTPEIGKEYGFYHDDIKHIVIGKFQGYRCYHGLGMTGVENYKNIINKPIQQSEEELKAIELLKNLGYKIEK